MSFSLWPSSSSVGSLSSPSDGGGKQLSTPALDFIGVIYSTGLPIVHYRDVAKLSSTDASRFVGSGGHAVVEVANLPGGACVAVKRTRRSGHSDSDLATHSDRILAQMTLELRVLTRQQLRGHPHLVNIRGVCYEEPIADSSTGGIGQFHLLLEYSRLGDMASFLRHNVQQLDIQAKIDLVRQVGCGLSILHEFHICHGDLKIQNVLVFNGKDSGYVAKLADFGVSIHSHEREIHYPSGTPLLNAPEMRNGHLSAQPVGIAAVIRTDIFSFGLLAWEVIQDGRSYFSPAWMDTGGASSLENGVEEQMAFLSSLPRNGLLMRGEEFLSTQNLDNRLHQQILRVFQASLQDEPLHRQQISNIVETMPMPHKNDGTVFETLKKWDPVLAALHRSEGFPTWTDPYIDYDLSVYIILDLPDKVQRRALDELKMCATSSSALDDLETMRQHAARKVAECYLISFGTDYDSAEVLRWLKIAKSYDGRTGLCLDRISEALGYPLEDPRTPENQLFADSEDNEAKGSATPELYLVGKIQSTVASVVNQIQDLTLKHPSRNVEAVKMEASALLSLETGLTYGSDMTALDIATLLGDNGNVARLLLTADSSGNRKQQLNAVHYACMGGNLSTLKLVLDQGVDPLLHGAKNVTALHFLIFMPADVVGSALDLLIAHGALTDIHSEPILLADTDLRLVGTPLEWAVVARNRALVDALLPHYKGQEGSMLRLAIKRAYYEIAADLLSNDAVRNVVTSDHCPLFVVDRPFSHLIVHGLDGDLAIERTMRLCDKYGLINYEALLRDSIRLARTPSCFKSIEVLLDLCPPTAIRYGFDIEDTPAIETTLYLAFSCAKANTAWKNILEVMVRNFSVDELNEVKEVGNALHMAVFQGWAIAVRVLLEKGVDVHRRTNMSIPCSSFDLAVRAVNVETMAMLAEFGGGADSLLGHSFAHENFAWWLQNQKATMNLGFKGVFHEYVGDKDAVTLSVARSMHKLLVYLLCSRDTHFGPGPSDEQKNLRSESLWNDYRALVSNESVARCIDVPDDNGVTMLQRAAAFLDVDVVRLLLEVGADANVAYSAKKIGGDENGPTVSFLPFEIACWVGRVPPFLYEKGHVATFEETNTPFPKQADPKVKTTRTLHFLHRIGLAITQAVETRAKRIGIKTGGRASTPGMRAAESLRAKSLCVALDILHWHQVREDRRFDGITELHLCSYMLHVQRALTLVHQGRDPDVKASWPGREGKYNIFELGRLASRAEWKTLNFQKLRGYGQFRPSRTPEEAALFLSTVTEPQAGVQ